MLTKSQATDACNTECATYQDAERAAGRHPGLYPYFGEERARRAEAAGEFWLAAEWWSCASTYTMGHNRAARYDDAAARCRRLAEEAEQATPT